VLQYVARFLKRHIREADYVFRWGGDEVPGADHVRRRGARRKAQMLKAAFDARRRRRSCRQPRPQRRLGGSAGGTTELLPLVTEADTRMYADKGRPAGRAPGAASHRLRKRR